MTKRLIFSGLIIVFFAILSGGLFYRFFYLPIAATVGDSKISQKDIEYKMSIDQCYGSEASRETALLELIRDTLEKEVLKKAFFVYPEKDILEKKSKWIDENTKAPKILKCVKKIFENNHEKYLQLYVAPTLINPRLHSEFSKSKKIHNSETKKIQEIFNQIKNDKDIASFKEYKEVQISEVTTTLPKNLEKLKKYGINSIDKLPPDLKKSILAKRDKDPLVEKILKNLKPGQIHPKIIEDDNSYKIIKFIKKQGDVYYCGVINIAKKNFDKWYQDFAKKNIKVKIRDSFLKKQIKNDHPNLYYLST